MKIIRKFILFSFFVLISSSLFADEGMWLPDQLNESNWKRMRELGFLLSEVELCDTINPSIKDAIAIFGSGCTGVTVSKEGLILTNHHCGFEFIQSQSTLEHDYLTNGFIANTKEDELKIPDLKVRYLEYTKDVTDYILSSVDSISEEVDRKEKIDSLIAQLQDSIIKDQPFLEAKVLSYYEGNEYRLNVYKIYDDVRLVFAPPSSLGKFGGDTDNWMWPRQTCDFCVFRVYTDDQLKYIPVSLDGVRENDFSMTLGFPGTTYRYLPSWGIKQMMEAENNPRIETRGIKQSIWKMAMAEDESIKLKYASKYVRSSNYWKNAMGINRGIERANIISVREKEETNFSDWASSDSSTNAEYGEVLQSLKENYTLSTPVLTAQTYLYEAFYAGSEIVRLTKNVMGYDSSKSEEEQQEYWDKNLKDFYKDYVPSLDQQVLAAMLKLVKERIPQDYLPHIYSEIDKKYKGDYEKYAAYVFEKSLIPYPEKLLSILKNPKKVKKLDKDPAYQLTKSVAESMNATFFGWDTYGYDIEKGNRLYVAGLKLKEPMRNYYPDANFTMRLSYGKVVGYIPYDGAWYDYYTTQKGLLEKCKKNDPEFDLPDHFRNLLINKDFGRYASEDGNLHLCFISDNDITGGNSGSPVLNKKGELIGLAFDGNWESTSSDILYQPLVERTISVDIRYVLFVIEKWGKCHWLVEELVE